MKSIFKIVIAVVLILSMIIPFSTLTTSAASQATEAKNKVSYLMDKKKLYTYMIDGHIPMTYKFQKKVGQYDYWTESESSFGIRETKNGLFDDGWRGKLLAYPVKLNKSWNSSKDLGSNLKIISIKKKVKVKAGTFKNVVVVKEVMPEGNENDEYFLYYYAPNVGSILETYYGELSGYKTYKMKELIKIKNK
ncbi:hypothetical protein ACIQ4I_12365 [Rummeliibacillus sp. NPDC094406]|uniref:hypothetical protein n=1 Tax=Rummeliibacillus sp. NPDC094406 TaxID=3364511 RepID=UPI0037FD8262